MAVERVTETTDAAPVRERVIERSGGSGLGAVIIGIAVLALVAVIGFYLLTANHNDSLRTEAVTGAASSVSGAAKSVGDAADNAAQAVNPNR